MYSPCFSSVWLLAPQYWFNLLCAFFCRVSQNDNSVDCGEHVALGCNACPTTMDSKGRLPAKGEEHTWCHGDCMWDDKKVDEEGNPIVEEACRENSDPKP